MAVTVLTTYSGATPVAGHADPQQAESSPITLHPKVLATIAHDPAAYTEGLELDGTALYESTGEAGRSQVREIDPATGVVRRAVPLPDNLYGEGLTVAGDRLWQLTYRDGVALEWDKASLRLLREVPFAGEGWGLCRDGDHLVRSDGTERLYFHNLADFTETGSVTVTSAGAAVTGLNELECVDGRIWANVWPSDELVQIDPGTGIVTAVVDARGMMVGGRRNDQVLNGIAHIDGQEFLLTAKNWPLMYRVRLDPLA
ncbi:glutaminyl-peptide cyclotransferase [Mycobacterium sp. CBMA 234]|nr:glutaminyl-peptide cyclotransferase [Mycolicibacterium sp. CBMA 234]